MNNELSKKNIVSFKDLHAWQEGHRLVLLIYETSKLFPRDELFALTSQIKRAAVSITSNIAEGFSRKSYKEKLQFYTIALGSTTEVQNQIEIAKDIHYIEQEEYDKVLEQSVVVHKLLNGLMKGARIIIHTA